MIVELIMKPKIELFSKSDETFRTGGKKVELVFKVIDYPISHPRVAAVKECDTLLKCTFRITADRIRKMKKDDPELDIMNRILNIDIDKDLMENYFKVNFPLNHNTVDFKDMDKKYKDFCIGSIINFK